MGTPADRRNNFDGLRLIAALSVLLSHAFLLGEGSEAGDPLMRLTHGQCPLGVAGVFVFFTLSGYLVSQSLAATGSVPRFLMKRALRIFPGLLLCLLATVLLLGPLATGLPLPAYFLDSDTYGYGVANLLLYADWNGLPGVRFSGFDAGTVVNGPLWSLPCEALMYLLLAALGTARQVTLPVTATLLALGLFCLALDTTASGYLLGSAGWLLPFFAAGMLLFQWRDIAFRDGRLALVALAGLVLSGAFGGFILLFPICGSYLVLALALDRRLPMVRAARYGDLSYGLYIYGWPVEQMVVQSQGGAAPWWQVLAIALPITAALAFLSWQLVEQPALRLKQARFGRRRAVPTG